MYKLFCDEEQHVSEESLGLNNSFVVKAALILRKVGAITFASISVDTGWKE